MEKIVAYFIIWTVILVICLFLRSWKGVKMALYWILWPAVLLFNVGLILVIGIVFPLILTERTNNNLYWLLVPVFFYGAGLIARGIHWLHERLIA